MHEQHPLKCFKPITFCSVSLTRPTCLVEAPWSFIFSQAAPRRNLTTRLRPGGEPHLTTRPQAVWIGLISGENEKAQSNWWLRCPLQEQPHSMQPPPHPKWATCRSLVSLPAKCICSLYCSHVTDPKTCCLFFCVMQHGVARCGCKERCRHLVFVSALSSVQRAAGWWAEVGTVEATPLWYDAIQRSISDIHLIQPTSLCLSVCCFLVCPNLPLKAFLLLLWKLFCFFCQMYRIDHYSYSV